MNQAIERQFETDLVKALLTMLLDQDLITTKEYQNMLEEHQKMV